MKNKKGFVMTETLVVTVFLVTIFTFIYISIVPLIGRYEDMVNRSSDIDIVYKLYHIRKMLKSDNNKDTITNTSSVPITCDDFATTYCSQLIQFLELDSYLLIYTNSVSTTLANLTNPTFINNNYTGYSQQSINEVYNYLSNYSDLTGNVLVLLDRNNHTIAHLIYYN